MEKMKATVLYGVGKIGLEMVEKPVPKEGEVLIKVETATTCGTDVKTYVRGYLDDVFPRLFGHGEVAGTVAAVGDKVSKFRIGERVVAHNSATCMQCENCIAQEYQGCLNLDKYNKLIKDNPMRYFGSYQEYYLVPEHIVKINMFKIPDDIEYEEACQLEPFSCAVNGSSISNVQLGDTVAIIGCGPQGLYHMQVTGLLGAATHIMVDTSEYRIGIAKQIHSKRPGKIFTINAAKENVEEKMKELTGGLGPEVIIEAAGLGETDEQAVRMVKKMGTVNFYAGAKPGTKVTVDQNMIHYRQITIQGTQHTNPYYVHKAWKLITTHAVDLKSVVTNHMKLDDIQKAFDILLTSKEAEKIAIKP
jgi:L-iditol 2-dehydrogenase